MNELDPSREVPDPSKPSVLPTSPKRPITGRMVAVLSLYYRPPDDDPFPLEAQFSRPLQSDDTPSAINVQLETDWLPLVSFTQHLSERVSVVWVKNKGPGRVEVGFRPSSFSPIEQTIPALQVKRGEAWPFPLLLSASTVYLRSDTKAKTVVSCFPE